MSHRTIIDGYNLLHAAGLVRGKLMGRQLEGARLRLLKRLAHQLSKEERPQTTVVFDAKVILPVSSREELIEGIRVLYPEPGHEADELIEQLIAQDLQPRKLLIVSSDRRLHRAARERMATAINSDRYLDRLDERRAPPSDDVSMSSKPGRPAVPVPPASPKQAGQVRGMDGDVTFWIKEFGDIQIPTDDELSVALEQELSISPPAGLDTVDSPAVGKGIANRAPSTSSPSEPRGRTPPPVAKQSLIIPLAPRPDLARLPPRPKQPTTQLPVDSEPFPDATPEKPIDADLDRWKDVLRQVLDEEQRRPEKGR